MASMKRRDFLRLSGTFLVAAKLTGCGGDDDGATPDGGPDAPTTGVYRYPQGVASGDPRETSVVLWTRAERVAGGTADIELKVEVATDEAFANVVAMRDLWAV